MEGTLRSRRPAYHTRPLRCSARTGLRLITCNAW
jgi:hypothetical protein